MGVQVRTQVCASHRVRKGRYAETISPATAGAPLPPLFQIPFSGTRAARERANVILTVSCAFEKRHSFVVLRPQARAGANRAQARLLGRRLGSGAIGVTR